MRTIKKQHVAIYSMKLLYKNFDLTKSEFRFLLHVMLSKQILIKFIFLELKTSLVLEIQLFNTEIFFLIRLLRIQTSAANTLSTRVRLTDSNIIN